VTQAKGNKYHNKLDQMNTVAEAIANNPRMKSQEIKKLMGYRPNTAPKVLDFLKSPAFKKLVEHKHLTAALQASEHQATFFGLKPVADIMTAELMQRVVDDECRNEIPTKTLLEFLIRFSRIENEMSDKQEQKNSRPDSDKVLADMRAQVSEASMVGKVVKREALDA